MDSVGGTGKGVFVLDSNSLSRSETSINLLREIWEAVSAILTFARVTLFRGYEDFPVSSGVGGSTDVPRTTTDGIDTSCFHFQRTFKKKTSFGSESARL